MTSCVIDWLNFHKMSSRPSSLSPQRPPNQSSNFPPAQASRLWAEWLSVASGRLERLRMTAGCSWVRIAVVVLVCVHVCVLPAITSSILSSIIHVRRIITLARSLFATSDITVNPLTRGNTQNANTDFPHTHTHTDFKHSNMIANIEKKKSHSSTRQSNFPPRLSLTALFCVATETRY